MSDGHVHKFNEEHVLPVALKDIPTSTWEIVAVGKDPRRVDAHLLLRPTKEAPVWRVANFVDVDDNGWRIEQVIEMFQPEDLVSITYIKPDGERREVSLER